MTTKLLLCVAAAAAVIAVSARTADAAPATGDTYVYRITNKYNKESRGEVRLRIEQIAADGTTVSVTPSKSEAGAPRTQVYAKDGNWLRHPLESHGKPVEYIFAAPYPAYVFPLEAGKRWSVRVKATPADEGRARTVRVDGRVLRAERVRVPAGEFDTFVIERRVYAGDADHMLSETAIRETEWYAPELGRAVRFERNSQWRDLNLCGRGAKCDMRGDWDLVELVEARAAKR
jgi:hypothetical protein